MFAVERVPLPRCSTCGARSDDTTALREDDVFPHDDDEADRLPLHESWLYALLSCFLMSLCSLSGVALLAYGVTKTACVVTELLAMSAGTMLASAFLILFPEADALLGFGIKTNCAVLGGVLFAFFSEKIAHQHAHDVCEPSAALHTHGRGLTHHICESCTTEQEALLRTNSGEKELLSGSAADATAAYATTAATTIVDIDLEMAVERLPPPDAVCVTTSCDDVDASAPTVTAAVETTDAAIVPTALSQYGKGVHAVAKTCSPGHANMHLHHERAGNIKTLAYVNIAGDLVHNFIDGALVGAVFLISVRTGFITALSILLHELPQELGDFAILLHAGYSPATALVINFGVSLSAVVGCVLSLLIGAEFEESIAYLLPIAGGMFIYLALACVVPELMRVKDRRANMRLLLAFSLGIGIIALTLLLPHAHGHEGDDHGH